MRSINCFLFSKLNANEMQIVNQVIGEPVVALKGDELYKIGKIGILACGSAKIKRQSNIGTTVTIRSLKEGDIFGAASIFGEWKEGFSSITADTKCSVYYISQQDLEALFLKIPNVALNYIAFLTDRIRFLNRRIDAFSAGSTESRLYEFLLSQADINGKVKLDFGMSELSRRLKIGRSSLYRSLVLLEKSGHIERNKNIFTII